jgi:hypothetical protein
MTFATPDTPGSYILEITLIQELCLWFADAPGADQSVRVPIEITAH